MTIINFNLSAQRRPNIVPRRSFLCAWGIARANLTCLKAFHRSDKIFSFGGLFFRPGTNHLWLGLLIKSRALSNSHLISIFYVNFVPLFSFSLFYIIEICKLEQRELESLMSYVMYRDSSELGYDRFVILFFSSPTHFTNWNGYSNNACIGNAVDIESTRDPTNTSLTHLENY